MASVDSSTRIAVIGGGKMGTAIIGGLIASSKHPAEVLSAQNFIVANPGHVRRDAIQAEYGVRCVKDVTLIDGADIVILAVKPQILPQVLDDIAVSALGAQAGDPASILFVSIAAGVSIAKIAEHLPAGSRIVRVMPNMPLLIGEGASAVAAAPEGNEEDAELVRDLFLCLGASCIVEEEKLDAVTALSGSGPAYVAALIEAMSEAGVEEGLSATMSEHLAVQTVLGTAAYIQQTGTSPRETLESICSPGGTTLAGLQAMRSRGFSESIEAGVKAAAERSRELGSS